MSNSSFSRRKFITKALAALAMLVGIAYLIPERLFNLLKGSQTPIDYEPPAEISKNQKVLKPTLPCEDESPTLSEIEGPYYTPQTPLRYNIMEGAVHGVSLVLTGRVVDTNCNPIPNAVLDFWQADHQGEYDNEGYQLRGHQFTDAQGQYQLETIKPRFYSMGARLSRTPHIHVKVKGPSSKLLTTQLYFPGEELNENDSLYHKELEVKLEKLADGSLQASFDFVLEV